MGSGFAECLRHFPDHPGHLDLQWHFFQADVGKWVFDQSSKTIAAPGIVHVIGHTTEIGCPMIGGSYMLVGIKDNYPLYNKLGSRSVIRYSATSDRWCIDCDGLKEPSILSKIYHWVLNGDASLASDKCHAFTDPCNGAPHPGYVQLRWNVFSSRRGSHVPEPQVRCTTAPLALEVIGRAQFDENADIVGCYNLHGTFNEKPLYVKHGTQMVLRYNAMHRAYVISRRGLTQDSSCIAFADNSEDVDHPAQLTGQVWHVWQMQRGKHMLDQNLLVRVPENAPTYMQDVASDLRRVPDMDQSVAKRRRVMEHVAMGAPAWPRACGGA